MIYEYAIYVGQLDLESGAVDNLQCLSANTVPGLSKLEGVYHYQAKEGRYVPPIFSVRLRRPVVAANCVSA